MGSAINNVPPSSPHSPDPGPLYIVISGPGGVGKGTIVEALLRADPRLWLSRSWSTRDPRPGEPLDAYTFVSREAFDQHIAEGGFLEWVDFLDYRQGTPVPEVAASADSAFGTPTHIGRDIVFEIDVHGGVAIAQKFDSPLLLFIDTPSREEQRRRLEGRGDPEHKVTARIERGDQEREIAQNNGYVTVINDQLDTTVEEILQLIGEARANLTT